MLVGEPAKQLRHDRRRFLIGDAAHMMLPFAGQGLNSDIRNGQPGLEDRRGARGALDALPDMYEAERKPHVSAIILQSGRLTWPQTTWSR
jgi:3-(3-hydroxy-phenyl)propionate hydroxylase